MGGIVGFNSGTNAVIENSYNIGMIFCGARADMLGGIVGRNNSGATIRNCYSTGTYTYSSIVYFGGVNGYNYSPSIINNSYYLNTTATKAYNPANISGVTNCTSKTEQEMKDASFVALLDTDNEESVWSADTTGINNGYPILKWQLQQ